jgi:hypothetical protein
MEGGMWGGVGWLLLLQTTVELKYAELLAIYVLKFGGHDDIILLKGAWYPESPVIDRKTITPRVRTDLAKRTVEPFVEASRIDNQVVIRDLPPYMSTIPGKTGVYAVVLDRMFDELLWPHD